MASLEVGIVGLPNSGKTSLFNALTESHAEVTSYAAVQASANVGIAAVPDERIAALAQAVSARAEVPATVQFSDVSGLVRGSGARDGGLGGEYLGHLRATDALAHVVRVFDDEAVSHPDGRIDPVADAEAVDFELLLSDQELVTRRRERTERAARVGEKSARDELVVLERLAAHLDEGLPARTLGAELPEGLDLLTTKPVIYVANVSEAGEPERVAALTAYATERGAEVVAVAARFEAELAELEDPADRTAFLADLGLDEPGMPRLARACFRTLGLITFFTAGPIEARAWPLREGASALEAAGKIHSDIARGFIRAEVIRWDDLVAVRLARRGPEARRPAGRGPRLHRDRRRRAQHPLQRLSGRAPGRARPLGAACYGDEDVERGRDEHVRQVRREDLELVRGADRPAHLADDAGDTARRRRHDHAVRVHARGSEDAPEPHLRLANAVRQRSRRWRRSRARRR